MNNSALIHHKSKPLTVSVDGFFIQRGVSFGVDTEIGVCQDTL